MPNAPNNATVVEICTRRIRALGTYVDRKSVVAINGRKHAHAEVTAVYQRSIDARAKVASLRAQLAEALGDVGDADAARMEADRALKAWVRGEFGVESTEANDFGFPAPKKAVLTVEQKVLAVERGRATRKARGTMGRRQKEGIRGVVEAPASPPSVAPTGSNAAPLPMGATVHGAPGGSMGGFAGAGGESHRGFEDGP
jgi:hypothetical protein